MFARRAWDLIDRGEFSAGLNRARTGVQEFPAYATGWYVLARAQKALNKLEDAVSSAERCLSIEPDYYAAWALLADLHEARSHSAAANSARLRLHELRGSRTPTDTPVEPTEDPAPPDTQNSNLPIVARQPRYDKSSSPPHRRLTLVRRAASGGSFETPTLAEVYRGQGLLDKALDVYVRILEHHPDDAGIKEMISQLKGEMSGRRRAIEKA